MLGYRILYVTEGYTLYRQVTFNKSKVILYLL